MFFCLRPIILLITLFLHFSNSAQAKSHFQSLSTDTQEDLILLKQITDKPNLLNMQYLDFCLGPKASAMYAPSSQTLRSPAPIFRIYWLDKDKNLNRYAFEQSIPSSNKYLAELSFSLTRHEDVLLKDLNKLLDKDPTRIFEENGQPAHLYNINPNIKVFAYQDSDVINLCRIAVQYTGPPLPPPSTADITEAIQHRRDSAFEHTELGHREKAAFLLKSHLLTNPYDAEAHLKLAQLYQSCSCINEAIGEYKIALHVSNTDSNIHEQCIKGLHSLKVDLPDSSLSQSSAVSPAPVTNNFIPAKINPSVDPTYQPRLNPNSDPKINPLEIGF